MHHSGLAPCLSLRRFTIAHLPARVKRRAGPCPQLFRARVQGTPGLLQVLVGHEALQGGQAGAVLERAGGEGGTGRSAWLPQQNLRDHAGCQAKR